MENKKSTTNSVNRKQSKGANYQGSASFIRHRHKHLEMERRYNLSTQATIEMDEGSSSASSTQEEIVA
ncbi:hypothetical protein L484_019380 [Morus notabilis]|uniref:Uncharacterized protein n=1 Tax=Morus notabilis TaxID=981085 RepID=W9RZT9_9ROSA|nr:hypothetical protein L484_019380 [Morus notabilis]